MKKNKFKIGDLIKCKVGSNNDFEYCIFLKKESEIWYKIFYLKRKQIYFTKQCNFIEIV